MEASPDFWRLPMWPTVKSATKRLQTNWETFAQNARVHPRRIGLGRSKVETLVARSSLPEPPPAWAESEACMRQFGKNQIIALDDKTPGKIWAAPKLHAALKRVHGVVSDSAWRSDGRWQHLHRNFLADVFAR